MVIVGVVDVNCQLKITNPDIPNEIMPKTITKIQETCFLPSLRICKLVSPLKLP